MKHCAPITRDKYLTNAELIQLFTILWLHRNDPEGEMAIALVRLILGTGLRVSEAVVLRKPEDCAEDGIISVRKSKTGLQRQVKVSPEYRDHYLARWHSLPDGLWFPRSAVNGRAYHNPYTTRWAQQLWADTLAAAGVRPLSIHAGRHTYATWEVASERLPLTKVKFQLGHKDEEMTSKFYAHSVTECTYETESPDWWDVAKHGPGTQRLSIAM